MRDWESESELDALESGTGELWGEALEAHEGVEAMGGQRAFDEVEEMALAGALLEVASEEELDRFLGDLIKRAGRAVGGVIRSPLGQTLTGILKNAAGQALPVIGGAIGSAVGGPSGEALGRQFATNAGQFFGVELEGLSPEDQQYEIARRFVRFAGAAAANAAQSEPSAAPPVVAEVAAADAAREHAPGFLAPHPAEPAVAGGRAPSGRWVRRGRTIVIVNCSAPGPSQTS